MTHVLMFPEAKILTGKEETHRCGRGKVRKVNWRDFPAIQGPGCQSWLGGSKIPRAAPGRPRNLEK